MHRHSSLFSPAVWRCHSRAAALALVLTCRGSGADAVQEGRVPASLYPVSHYATSGVSKRLEKATPGREGMAQYAQWDDASPVCVRSQSFWAADVDLSFVSSGCLRGGKWARDGCATLISPRHVLMADHAAYEPGTVIVFTTRAGERVQARLAKTVRVAESDIRIGLLEEPVAVEKITPVVIAPPGWFAVRDEKTGKWKLDARWLGVPLLCSSRDRFATVEVIVGLSRILVVARASKAPMLKPEDASSWDRFFIQPISGTSGSPLVALVEGKAFVLGHYTTAGPETGPCYPFFMEEIKAAMQTLGGVAGI